MTDVKHKTGPTMKAARDNLPIAPDYLPMDDAPKDGRYIYLRDPDGQPHECYWYETRQFRKGTWQQVGWWRERNAASAPIKFEPDGYRLVNQGILV